VAAMRVHITDLRTGDVLAEDVFNSFGLHVLSKGTELNARELSQLFQHQVDFMEIEPRGLFRSEPDEDDALAKSGYNPLLRPLYQDAVAGAEQLFERALKHGIIYEEDVKESFQPLIQNFKAERDVVSLLLLLNSQDDYTYEHSVQVGMLSFFIARWLGWNEEDTVRAGKAGFLHDIGKCRIPDAILNKPGKLTDEEFKEIRNHPKYGFDILKSSFNDSVLAIAALQHHERMDGSGYPLGLKSESIQPLAKVVAVADVYSAMISSRVYSEKKDLLFVLKELHALSFKELDPHVTHTFIRHMIPNFIGKKVVLTNGETGTIVMTNPSDFFRPLIKIGDEFLDLAAKRKYEIQLVIM
jgi:putative nucleotidyltransferase with HDIG domain